ncbi:MAG TPA: hypothetical protein VGN63_00915 [Flavisolibacter sp.]|jgi:hypothetical protein|nr:hypothetical protein [Flavisolibacter sp.]
MTLQHFRSLPLDTQRKVVQHSGVFLLGRTGVGVTAKLFQLNNFYVELFFNEKMSAVSRLVAFDDTAKLEHYLHLIPLTELQPLIRR